jgi:hypothetical protein
MKTSEKTTEKNPKHGFLLNMRINPRFIEEFDAEIARRGFLKRNDGLQQLISAWIRNPDALPIGIEPKN